MSNSTLKKTIKDFMVSSKEKTRQIRKPVIEKSMTKTDSFNTHPMMIVYCVPVTVE